MWKGEREQYFVVARPALLLRPQIQVAVVSEGLSQFFPCETGDSKGARYCPTKLPTRPEKGDANLCDFVALTFFPLAPLSMLDFGQARE